MTISVKCPCCGKENSVHLTMEQAMRHEAFERGDGHIQDLLPDLSADDRELLLTGICSECFALISEECKDE